MNSNKRIEKKLIRRVQLGDAKASFDLGSYLVSTFQYKRISEILEYLTKASDAGVIESVFWLGMIHEEDWNPRKSLSKSFKCYLKAAKLNHAEACNSVALCYLRGVGTKVNQVLGMNWLLKGAVLGNASAQFNLADSFEKGVDCKKNLALAKSWFEASLLQGHPEARYRLKKLVTK